ncbi:MAG: hypothetical protein MJ117_10635, partial [Lachnospiraceae bacterium]|nr:hypothetical protein [Lachnospiraceae bacterium]
ETPAETPSEALPVNVKGDDKPATDGSADKNHPIYTENVTIANGTLAEDFSENDIEFTGVFAGSKIQNLTVNDDRTGFTLVFTKEYVAAEQYFEGGMLVKGRAVLNGAGEASQKDFSVFMYDTYRVTKEEKESTDTNMSDAEFEKTLRTIINANMDFVMIGLFESLVPGPYIGRLTQFVGDMGVRWNATQANSAMKSSEDELNAIKEMNKNLSSQLSQATYDILKGIDYSQLVSTAQCIDDKVALVKSDYRNYLDIMNGLYDMAQNGTLANNPKYVDQKMESVYKYGNGNPHISKAEMANFTCYDHLYNLGEMMLGQGLFESKDIFRIYQGIVSNKYNYNTMSFADRRAYNENVLNFYDQGYTALLAAISYDLDKNTALKEEYTKELTELEKLSKKTLSACAKMTLDEKMQTVKAAESNTEDAIRSDNMRMEDLKAQREALKHAKDASDDIITNEEGASFVICYCNNVQYDRNLAVCVSTPENFPVGGAFEKANVENFIDFNRYSTPAFSGGGSSTISWKIKPEWQGKEDKSCTGADAFKNSIVYSSDNNTDLNYLNKIAHDKSHTLTQELGEAFQYQGKSAAAAMEEGAAVGYYNGGNFSTDDTEFFKNRYCYELSLFLFFTKAQYVDYNWVKIQHNVNYIDKDGNAKTNVETKKYALTKEKSFSGPSIPSQDQLHKEEEFEGTGVNLFLVNCYKVNK